MYEENKKRVNWVTTLLKVIVLALVILLSLKLVDIIVSKQKTSTKESKYNELLKSMDDYANELFTIDSIPDTSGKTKVIYLKELIDNKKIKNESSCDINSSYIKVVRLDTEYEIKTYLVCDNYENSINSYKKLKSDITIKPHTTTTTTKPTTTTTKRVIKTTAKTTNKKYKLSFNTNGGEPIDDISISANGVLKNEPIPVRNGYKFIGWYYHGRQFNFSTKINQDYVFTARWVLE